MSRPPTLLAAGLLATLALAGCSRLADSPQTPAAAPAHRSHPASASASASVSPSATGSATSTPVEPVQASPSAAGTPAAPKPKLADRLLPAAELPGFNDGFTWTEAATRTEEQDLFGTCERFSITSIGAMRVAVRYYAAAAGGDDTTGGELVADFADQKTAAGAMDVLRAWRSKCGEELRKYDDPKVGELEPVAVEDADAGWYLLTYRSPDGPADEQWFDAQGLVRVGSRVALVRLAVLGQDYDYEAGREPMVAALQRAAARL